MIVFFLRLLLLMALCVVCSCGMQGKRMFNESIDNTKFQTVEIAPVDDALSFARVRIQGKRHCVAVLSYHNGVIKGVDLTQALNGRFDDPIDMYLELGYSGVSRHVSDFKSSHLITLRPDQLIIPVDLLDKHIAAGTNYSAHAGETGVVDGPFLFPKHVEPTGPYDAVPVHEGLIDYEVELAAVTLRPVQDGNSPGEIGLILTNDFTDRAALLRHIDVKDVSSGKGFTTGKSFPGFLPVGNVFVIPRNPGAFAKKLVLELYVNDQLRQRSETGLMVWDFDEIVSEIRGKKEAAWEHNGESVTLVYGNSIVPARTLILSGTPHGVIFQGIPFKTKLKGIGKWLAGGWGRSIPQNVIEVYIKEATTSGTYLKPGDSVSIHVDKLGILLNDMVAPH